MHDPLEGVTPAGMITTGVSRRRVPAVFEPVVSAAVEAVAEAGTVSLYLYGSVATGMARLGESDVDLLTVGMAPASAVRLGDDLTRRFATVCRAVEIAPARMGDFAGESDEAYGGAVFLRHYCVHLTGPDVRSGPPEFLADVRAARAFNGDLGIHAARWRSRLVGDDDLASLARRIGRKSLLAVAGLVSIHDSTWTTDRTTAAERLTEIDPNLADGVDVLLAWSGGGGSPDASSIRWALDGIVARIVAAFEESIGLWDTRP